MVKKINQFIAFILGTKLMMWVVPDSKRFIKGIGVTIASILLIIYFHGEYLKWAEISGNITYLSFSYIIKNLLILILLIILIFYLKKTKKRPYAKVEGEEKIYSKNFNEDYFNKFKNKEKLRTKAEQILEKDEKEK